MKRLIGILVALALIAMVAGCNSQTCVIATSQTGVGIVAEWNAQSQTPTGKLGYIRNEVAIVPTNKTPDCAYDKDAVDAEQGGSGGAKDSPNVIMDFNLGNWFSFWETQTISNRIAVGDKAVKVAPFLFMQNMSAEQIEALKGMAPMINGMTKLAEAEDAADNAADIAAAQAHKRELQQAKSLKEAEKINKAYDKAKLEAAKAKAATDGKALGMTVKVIPAPATPAPAKEPAAPAQPNDAVNANGK